MNGCVYSGVHVDVCTGVCAYGNVYGAKRGSCKTTHRGYELMTCLTRCHAKRTLLYEVHQVEASRRQAHALAHPERQDAVDVVRADRPGTATRVRVLCHVLRDDFAIVRTLIQYVRDNAASQLI